MKNPHVCTRCGADAPRWAGRCDGCGEWNTLVAASASSAVLPRALSAVDVSDFALAPTGVGEFDRVLGGGLARGSSTLLFGEPGVGKSTLALMALVGRCRAGDRGLLIAAEESLAQIARRAQRLGAVPASLEVVALSDLGEAAALVRTRRPDVVVVDSLSAMSDASAAATPGSVSQLRLGAERLSQAAREALSALVLVGHVTKDGELAGPRALEHLVDSVVRIEGDRHGALRVLRALKHRFGPTGEVGLLEMVGDGLRELVEPALGRTATAPGVVVGVTSDGSRSLVVEVQALVVPAGAAPRRVAHQVSSQRLALLLAVLEARCQIACTGRDVFAATAGGLPATDPGIDAALALAVASASLEHPVGAELAAIGEVGLAGELRAVPGLGRRVLEAARRGVRTIVVPEEGDVDAPSGVTLVRRATLGQVVGEFVSQDLGVLVH